MSTTEPIRKKDQLRSMSDYFLEKGEIRNYTLVVCGVYTAMRIGDLLELKWEEVYDEKHNCFFSHVAIKEEKTGKPRNIALNEQAIAALRIYLPYRKSGYIFASRKGGQPITRTQAWRIIRGAAKELGLEGNISCHSLRKTWGYHAWTSGKVSPVVIMEVYNHSDFRITQRYLGIEQDDLDRAYLEMELF